MQLTETFQRVKTASRTLALITDQQRNDILLAVADAILQHKDRILAANAKDLARMDKNNPMYDRLQLTDKRLDDIAADMRNVATLPTPLGHVTRQKTLPNGLRLCRVSVPFGVIGMIYEARPNVTYDVFSLCFKSGNACVLKGGSDADLSNQAAIEIIHDVLRSHQVSPDVCTLLPATHEATGQLLNAVGYVDLCIPRGGRRLIDFVRDTARIPVIETGAGVVNTYFDRDGDLDKGRAIVNNAKTRRPSVCNSLDCLIIHESRLGDLFELVKPLLDHKVMLYADAPAHQLLTGHYPDILLQPATDEAFGTEFMDYKMAIRTVTSLEEALDHIDRYGSGHSESIITENPDTAHRFQQMVDAACVYWNAPTSFTDGAQFGLGAEIGISTQKAAMNLGMNVIVLDVNAGAWKLETERGVIMDGDKSEHLLEAIPVMGCYCDLIGVRSFAGLSDREYDYAETVLQQFIRYSGRPVFAMETATVHPLQAFADLITIEENWVMGDRCSVMDKSNTQHPTPITQHPRPKVVLTWAPHCRALPQAVPNSFAQWMRAADVDFVVTHPKGYELDPKFVGSARVEYDQRRAFEGADFIYAKNWSNPGVTNPADYGKITCEDRSWTVDAEHMSWTRNAKFMHCLPVRRNLIVTDDVIESPNSIVIPEAANREISCSVVIKRMLEAL